ncbi:MAG: hypothetical protein AB4368_06655 [Xenococcaceae cyanobacterium]
MTQDFNNLQQDCCFQEVIERSSQTYCGSKLSAKDSYGYSRLLMLLHQ